MKKKIFLILIMATMFIPTVSGDIGNKVIITSDKEGITFNRIYSIDGTFRNWTITGNKAINIKLKIVNNTRNATILIEHLHADIFIESTYSAFDDLTQDSMDDSFHGVQGGFLVTEDYFYEEVFSIEGSSPSFIRSTQNAYIYGGFASSSGTATEIKYSEARLINTYRVYGQTLVVIFDVLIKYENETYYHKHIIADNIFFDLEGTPEDNRGNSLDYESQPFIDGFPTFIIVGVILASVIGVIKRKKINTTNR